MGAIVQRNVKGFVDPSSCGQTVMRLQRELMRESIHAQVTIVPFDSNILKQQLKFTSSHTGLSLALSPLIQLVVLITLSVVN